MNKKRLIIFTLSLIVVIMVGLMVRNNQQRFSTKAHFTTWELTYPQTKEILEFKSKRSFGNDFADAMVFSTNDQLEKEIQQYIMGHEGWVTRTGDEEDKVYSPSTLKIFHDFSDHQLLEKRMNSYEHYDYWIFEKNDGFEKLGILMSEEEVVYVFIKL